MDSLLVDVAIVAEPPDCSRPYFEFMAFIKSHQCVRVFWVHRQTPETLPVSKIRNYLPRPYGYLLRVGHFCTFLPQGAPQTRSEEHTSELQSHSDLVCRLLLEIK